jgi:hypothetical protein
MRAIEVAIILGFVLASHGVAQEEKAGSTSVPRSPISSVRGSADRCPAGDVKRSTKAGSTSVEREPDTTAAAVEKPGPPGTRTLDLGRMTFQFPDSWKNVPPSSQLRMAEITIPRDPKDAEDGCLGVFYLGPTAGSTEANISRWCGQVSQPDGRPSEKVAQRENFKVDGLSVALVDVGGNLDASTCGGGGDRKGYRLIGAVVETPGGPWFFKATGPDRTMVNARSLLRKLLTSVKVK